jgi:Asp/Glu/hydantoin racemase
MRIWYQSLVDSGRTPAYFDAMAARAKTIARPGTDVSFAPMPAGVYGGHAPAEVVVYPYLASLLHQCILDHALKAEAQGYDVFAIGSVQDPALEEARSLLDIPVVGYGEAAMHFACLLGSRFAFIVFQAGFEQMMDLRVERLGLGSRALPTVLMDATFDDIGRAQDDPAALVAHFSAAARRAIALGADVVIPGQLYLSEAIARAGLTRIDDAPVVDAMTATLKMAEAMADFRRQGISVTRRGYLYARAPRDILDHARAFHRRDPPAPGD